LPMRPGLLAATRISILLAYAVWIVGPWICAGGKGWPALWVYDGVLAAALAAQGVYVRRSNPELRQVRRDIRAGTPSWDLVWNVVFWWLMASEPLAAAAQHRAHVAGWASWTSLPGAAVVAGGLALSGRAMAVNRFFEATVRLQTDRGQTVVETGPYRVVRHPGYLGLWLWAAGTPLLLRSVWALIPCALLLVWIPLRTGLEDRLLRRGLAHYDDYARRVRWRLLPGIW